MTAARPAAIDLDRLRAAVGEVPDPELPMLSIADLGILRAVDVDGGRVRVDLTPTYSGCPAIEAIEADVRTVLVRHGHPDAEVRFVLAPAWSTDDITDAGRRTLAEHGVAPPRPTGPTAGATGPVPVALSVRCPRCGSLDTGEISRFGPTPCQALRACRSCREPFEYVKPH